MEVLRGVSLLGVTAGVAGLLALSGCGGSEKSASNSGNSSSSPAAPTTPARLRCTAEHPERWGVLPSRVVGPTIAKSLGITVGQLANAPFGIAVCERAVRPEEISVQPLPVMVGGQSDNCVAIGLQAEQLGPTERVFAVCAPSSSTGVRA